MLIGNFRMSFPSGKVQKLRLPERSSGSKYPSDATCFPSLLKATKLIQPHLLGGLLTPICFTGSNTRCWPCEAAAQSRSDRVIGIERQRMVSCSF